MADDGFVLVNSPATSVTSGDSASVGSFEFVSNVTDSIYELFGSREHGEIVGELLRVAKRRRIIHDILPYESGRQADSYIARFKEKGNSYPGGIFIVSDHKKENFSHLHIVHDCNYYNSSCRCAILHGLSIKRRSRRSGIWAVCTTRKYWWNITAYLFSEERTNVYNYIGGKSWGCIDPIKGNL